MALTKKDLVQINDLIASQLSVHLAAQDARFALAFERHAQDIKRDIRDEMDARFLASERKTDVRFNEVDAKIERLDTKVTNEIQSLVHVILSFFLSDLNLSKVMSPV